MKWYVITEIKINNKRNKNKSSQIFLNRVIKHFTGIGRAAQIFIETGFHEGVRRPSHPGSFLRSLPHPDDRPQRR